QHLQQRVLTVGEFLDPAVDLYSAGTDVEAHATVLEDARVVSGLVLAQAQADTSEQFGDAERLDHVVIRPGIQSLDRVGDAVAGGEDDDGGVEPTIPRLAQQGQTVRVGKAYVEQHEIDVGDRRQDGASALSVDRL